MRKRSFKYYVPDDIAKRINENLDCILLGKDPKQIILNENQAQKNIDLLKMSDQGIAKVVEGSKETFTDKDIETVQSEMIWAQCVDYGQS